ncbi:MAG: PQQ-binding-like beta-propeller repeat protein [Planctomycetes bacterium]|nr:PQQ-binding-like beta-propeller repeat protein [Planctomycetota bacterium]
MTDDQLVRLVQETPPEELSASQLALLRQRLPFSHELRGAIREQIRLEQLLNTALGRYGVDVTAVLERAARLRRRRRLIAVALAAAVLVPLSFIGYRVANRPASDEAGHVVAVNTGPTKPVGGATDNKQPNAAVMPDADPGPANNEPAMPKPIAVPVVPATGAGGQAAPWVETLARPVRPIAQACYDELPFDTSGRAANDLSQWWQTLSGSSQSATRRRVNGLSMRGRFRLLAPWTPGTVWRINVGQPSDFQLHLWAGQQGVTLDYFEKPYLGWAAYQATRGGAQPTPDALSLTTHDEQRYARLGRGVVELRYQAAHIVLSRGQIPLLIVPLAEAPQEVILDSGKDTAFLAGMELLRSEPFSFTVPTPRTVVATPQERDWQTSLPQGAIWSPAPNGTLSLTATNPDRDVRAWFPVDVTRPTEFLFRIESSTPQTAVYLGDTDGKPRVGVAFVAAQNSRGHAYTFTRSLDSRNELKFNRDKTPIQTWTARPFWLRLAVAGGAVRCAISEDGQTWTRMFEPIREPQGRIASVGLYGNSGKGQRQLVVRSIELARPPTLNLFVEADILDQVRKSAPTQGTLDAWLKTVLAARPKNVAAEAWTAACAVEALAAGADGVLGSGLANGLLEAVETSALSEDDRVRQLDALGGLIDLSMGVLSNKWIDTYTAVALAAGEDRVRSPYDLIEPSLIGTSSVAVSTQSFFIDRLLRRQLIELVMRDDWNLVHQFCRQLHFFGGRSYSDGARGHPEDRLPLEREQTMRLADWAAALAVRNLPEDQLHEQRPPTAVPTQWRHPLVEQLGKESFNVLADFEAAVSGGALKDACQVLNHLTLGQLDGLIPRKRDPDWLTPLPEAVAAIMRDEPGLRQTMEQEFGSVAQLRFRQAANEADAETVALVALQFPGTTAAAEAHLWLGDRALAAGDAQQAARYYQLADNESLAMRRNDLRWRRELATAALGQPTPSLPSAPLTLGDESMSPEEAARLVAQLRRAAPSPDVSGSVTAARRKELAVPGPFACRAENLHKLEGSVGDKPEQMSRVDIDGFGWQLATTQVDDRLLVSNRFQISAYDLEKGTRLWTAPSTSPGSAAAHLLTAMKPAVRGNQVFARRLTTGGADVVCLDLSDGHPLWKTPDTIQPVSDPFPVGSSVVLVTAAWPQADTVQLSLTRLNAQSGNVEAEWPLLQLRDVWKRETPCHAARRDDLLVVATGGVVVATTLDGQLRWLRRQAWTGGMLDNKTQTWRAQPPLIVGDRVIVSQPGVPLVSCFDLPTGERHWQRVEFETLEYLTLTDKTTLIRTRDRLLAVANDSGDLQWQRTIAPESGAALVDARRILLAQPGLVDKARVTLTWFDAGSGQSLAAMTLNELTGQRPTCGALVALRGRLWGLVAGERRDPYRSLAEMKRAEDVALQPGSPLPASWVAEIQRTSDKSKQK